MFCSLLVIKMRFIFVLKGKELLQEDKLSWSQLPQSRKVFQVPFEIYENNVCCGF